MHVVNFWDRANLVYRYGHIVRDTVKRNRVAINRQEGRARVIVTRLSNRTGSQNCLSFGFQFVTLSNDWLNEFPFRWVVPFELPWMWEWPQMQTVSNCFAIRFSFFGS